MNPLATHQCVEIRKELDITGKRLVESSFDMKLFADKITVKHDCYSLTSVFDISYLKKQETSTISFLYLHTKQGVRTYYTRKEPVSFIEAFRKLKR